MNLFLREVGESLIRRWPDPENYFKGLRVSGPCPVDNLLAFSRERVEQLSGLHPMAAAHSRWVWVFALQGVATTVVEGVPYELRPGEALCIPAYTSHYHAALTDKDILWFFITFESYWPQWEWLSRRGRFRPGELEQQRLVTIVRALGEGRAERASLHLALWHEEMSQGVEETMRTDPLLRRVHSWAMNEREQLDNIRELAREMRMSQSYLRQRFREQTGLSLGRYLLHIRMSKAERWLREPGARVTDVAYRCGYSTPGNFSRAFTQEMGLSPRACQRRAGGNTELVKP